MSYLIRAGALALVLIGPWRADAQPPDPTGSATFLVLIDGTRIGTESVSVTRSGDDWIVSGTGFIRPPLDLSTTKFEVRYGPDWQPQNMTLEAALRGQPLVVYTSFGLTTATNSIVQGSQRSSSTQQITPRAAVVPNNFFTAYESLALRLASTPVGGRLPVYVPPTGETIVTVSSTTPRRVSLGNRTIELREFVLAAMSPSGVIPLELWIDDRGRLARLVMPTASLVILRDDLANVMAREERLSVEGDQDVLIGGAGFSISGTLTVPPGTQGRAPAVVLVAGPGPQDRDYIAYGIPLYAQLAQSLSAAGYAVLRYDSRGIGRSGGRPESSRLQEYADDVVGIVNWLRRRNDIDRDRIVVAGYSDTGPIALSAASRTDRIAAVALLNALGHTGREVTLERQEQALVASQVSETERANRLALQNRVMDAVITGRGWDQLPEDVRRQADTPWFRSWLLFDPAETMRRTNQPVLVLHGALNTEVPPAHATQLEALGRARRRPQTHTQATVLPGVNHLLLQATSGAVDEYATIQPRIVAPTVNETLLTWLRASLVRR